MSLAQAALGRNTPPPRTGGAAGYPRLGASVVVALAVALALLVWDDYGVGWDAEPQREIARQTVNLALGQETRWHNPVDRFYGVVLELPLLWAEAWFSDSRSVFLMRHLVTHLLFIMGGLACSMLAYRMFGDRRLALVALALFLLHPRIHAYSFINSKDVPFLSLFMIGLLATHHALGKRTVGAFLLCGVSLGVLVNLRITGLALFVGALGLWSLDFVVARAQGARRDWAPGVALVGAAALTLYAVSPALWANPAEIVTWARLMNSHPTLVTEVLQGELVTNRGLPAHYVPMWVAISTTPITLALGVIGGLTVCARGVARPAAVFTHPARRFEWLLLTCLVLPVGAVAVLGSNIHDGWRHLFFLWAPLTMLAMVGLNGMMRLTSRNLKRGVLALVTGSAATTFAQAAALHPYPYAYFNFLVDRTTPERLIWQYDLDWRYNAYAEAIRQLSASHADRSVLVGTWPANQGHLLWKQRKILPPQQRSWILIAGERPADLTFFHEGNAKLDALPADNVVFRAKAYNNTLAVVTGTPGGTPRDEWLATYRRLVAKPLVARAVFPIHAGERTLHYVKARCTAEDVEAPFFVQVFPARREDAGPNAGGNGGFVWFGFAFEQRGHRLEDKCWTSFPLPDFPIVGIRTGQYADAGWKWDVALSDAGLDALKARGAPANTAP